jgi:hypothetical protein
MKEKVMKTEDVIAHEFACGAATTLTLFSLPQENEQHYSLRKTEEASRFGKGACRTWNPHATTAPGLKDSRREWWNRTLQNWQFNVKEITMKTLSTVAMITVLALCSVHLAATTVTAGYIQAFEQYNAGNFALSGSGFSMSGSFSTYGFGAIRPGDLGAGARVPVWGSALGNDFLGGSATVGGNSYPAVNWGDLDAHHGSIFNLVGPDITLGSTAGTYYSTFSFTGELCGTTRGSLGDCTANFPVLSGSGIVKLDVVDSPIHGLLQVRSVTYEFVTPEPSTLALLGPATVGLAAVRRRLMK